MFNIHTEIFKNLFILIDMDIIMSLPFFSAPLISFNISHSHRNENRIGMLSNNKSKCAKHKSPPLSSHLTRIKKSI